MDAGGGPVGREHELWTLIERLAAGRLVTVTGPGGIGKTTLARAAVREWRDRTGGSTPFVDLSRVASDGSVRGAFAAALGFATFRDALDASEDDPSVVVVDNCEHVADAAAAAIGELLGARADVTCLATSRARLELPGESVLVLGPLQVADDGDPGKSPAVRLFVDRARDAGADVDTLDEAAAAELCRALDGIPLAIEIAAARSRILAPAQILARLGDPDTIARPRFRGEVRHRSLWATSQWSFDLLGERQQRSLAWLGAFAGPFDAELADGLLRPDDDGHAAVETLAELADASLLVTEGHRSVVHYRLLGTLRLFALEQLSRRGELFAAKDRLADVLTARAQDALARVDRRWDPELLADLNDLYDHFDAALHWCLDHDALPDRAGSLLKGLWRPSPRRDVGDVASLGGRLLARWPSPPAQHLGDHVEAAAIVAGCRILLGEPEPARTLAERALPAAVEAGVPTVSLHAVIGVASAIIGDDVAALAAFEAGRDGTSGGPRTTELETFIARLRADDGDVARAIVDLRAIAADAAAVGSVIDACWARVAEASELLRLRHADAAAALAIEQAAACRDVDFVDGWHAATQTLALAQVLLGDVAAAAATADDLLADLWRRGATRQLRTALYAAAVVLDAAGHPAAGDVGMTAMSLPVVSLFWRPGHEPIPLRSAGGQRRVPDDALSLARAALAAVSDPPGSPPHEAVTAAPAPATASAELVHRGDIWTISFGSLTVLVKASKGLDDLARLLSTPGREVHCLDLMGGAVEQAETGSLIDGEARRRYEDRLRDLQVELDEAEARNDAARAERLQAEFDRLLDHLAGALGLRGRTRRGGSNAERARSAVTQRIRAAIRSAAEAHPELGRHLAGAVSTGTFCSYHPEPPVRWRVERPVLVGPG